MTWIKLCFFILLCLKTGEFKDGDGIRGGSKKHLNHGVLYGIDILKTIPLFAGLSAKHLDKIQEIAQKTTFKKSQIIFHEGDRANGLYMVATGKIKVFKVSAEGREQILHIYGPGHTFGEVPVFEGKHFPATSMALETSEIIFLPRNRFVELISTTPALSMNMLADLSRRLREFTLQVEALSLKEVPARLAAYVITLAEEQDTKDTVELPISKAQLANLIGTTPETISRMLKKMGTAGLVRTQGKTIDIQDMDRLYELAESGRI